MTRIAHLSDLHFGFHRQALVEPLLSLVNRARVDLVVVTGDVTHRGRPGQFRMAAEFLDRIAAPVQVVPGNHDVPLYNFPARFLGPFAGYRQAISTDLAPTCVAGAARVLGLNSVDPFVWQRGVLRERDLSALTASLDPLSTNIVALHHPLEHLPQVDKQLPTAAHLALGRMANAGVQIILSGHLHVWTTEALMDQTRHPRLLQVQAGTALCARPGDVQNEVAILDLDGDQLIIERHIAPMSDAGFLPPKVLRLSRADGIWRLLSGTIAAPIPSVTNGPPQGTA